jgi:4-methyl-5(b-hydroxyethyl)-thiazole monophosphate biosynthesis
MARVEVVCAELTGQPVTACREVKFIPRRSLEEVKDEAFDTVVIPGAGDGVENRKRNPRVEAIPRRMDGRKKWVTAICAAPALLAAYGLLGGKGDEPSQSKGPNGIREGMLPGTEGCPRRAHHHQPRANAALEFALKLVAVLCGRETVGEVKEALVMKDEDSPFDYPFRSSGSPSHEAIPLISTSPW